MNVLVIVAGGLQPAYLGCYGNDWIDTPALDRLAAEGIVFDQHIADHPSAAGARRSWRTGRYHLPPANKADVPRHPEAADLLAQLRKHGIKTILISAAGQSLPEHFLQGWEQVESVRNAKKLPSQVANLLQVSSPSLLWLELASLLPPWDDVPDDLRQRYLEEEQLAEDEDDDDEAPGEGIEANPLAPLVDPAAGPIDPADDTTFIRLQRTYAAAVSHLDAGLERLFEALRRSDLGADTLVLFTSDRGLPLGEHGVVGECRSWLHEELIHVPLILRLPGAEQAGRRVAALTQPVDLLPTLLDALGLPIPPVHGQTLLPLARGAASQVRPFACSGLRVDSDLEWSLRTPDWALLLPVQSSSNRPAQLYVKPDDRWEVNNIIQHNLELAEGLERTLRDFISTTSQTGP